MASGRPTTKECRRCHHRFPVTEMRKETIEVNVGRSGVSVRWSPKGRGSRIYSGRKHYRKRVVWTCNGCSGVSTGKGSHWLAAFGWILLIAFVVWLFE